MRPLLLPLVALTVPVSAQLVVPLLRNPVPFDRPQAPLMVPLGPGPAMPPSDSPSADQPAGTGGGVMLSDVMGRDRSINLFASFIRDVEYATRRLEDASKNTTVLAPLNSAVEALPRKPWEDPRDYDALGAQAYDGRGGPERAQRNLARFVEAHLVPVSPWREGERVRPMGGDREIWWEEREGVRVIQPGAIEVVNVAGNVENGQVWIIKQVRNYAS